ncbi:MAG: tetratricopeptide repeat protein [Aggregatilineales bacterium]
MLEFNVLGYPEVYIDDELVENFLSNKVVVLLCYLALNPHVHARERLAGLFWGDMPDSKAKSNLRQALHDLNKRVGDYVEVTRQTVRFHADKPHDIDVLALKNTREDENASIDNLEAVSTRYRGMFLQGINLDVEGDLEEWLRAEQEHCRLNYIDVLDRLSQQYMQQAHWLKAETTLRKLEAIEPLREETHRQLMLAFARQGKYDDALAQFEVCKQNIYDELGVEPLQETINLYDSIHEARTLPRHNLPSNSGIFVGRARELNQINVWIRDPEIHFINILGVGGIGKSRLVRQFAHQHTDQFVHGVRYLSLTALTQTIQVAPALAQILELTLNTASSPLQQVGEYLKKREILLILDNAEHLADFADVLDSLLQETKRSKIVITSRIRFNLQQEHVFSLQGLQVPEITHLDDDLLANSESVQLYLKNAQRYLRDFDLSGHEAAIARFCKIVGGMPLAIEIGTALLPVISCEHLTQEIEKNLDLLDSPLQNIPERHQSLRAVFDHSWGLLAPKEQSTLTRLSVFRGTFSLDAAQQIASTNVTALHKLVSQSLLRMYTHEDGTTRYDIHVAIGQYAFEALVTDPEMLESVLNKHIDYYANLLRDNDRSLIQKKNRSANFSTSLKQTDMELSNVRVAWQYAVEQGRFDAIDTMSTALHRFFEGTNRFQEGSDLFEYALEFLRCDPCGDDEEIAISKVAVHYAGLHLRLGNLDRVQDLTVRSVAVFEATNQLADLGFALNILGIIHLYKGRFDEAKEALIRCAETYRAIDNSAELLKPLANLGSLSIRTGDHQTAKEVLNEGVTISEQLGDLRGLCHFLANLGAVYQDLGEYEIALGNYERVLVLSDAMSNLTVKSVTLMNMGEMRFKQNNFQGAIEALEDSTVILRQINDNRNLVGALMWGGLAYGGNHDHPKSLDYLIEALEIANRLEAKPIILNTLIGVGKYFIDFGRENKGQELLAYAIHHEATEHGFRNYARQLQQTGSHDNDDTTISTSLETMVIECLHELNLLKQSYE